MREGDRSGEQRVSILTLRGCRQGRDIDKGRERAGGLGSEVDKSRKGLDVTGGAWGSGHWIFHHQVGGGAQPTTHSRGLPRGHCPQEAKKGEKGTV